MKQRKSGFLRVGSSYMHAHQKYAHNSLKQLFTFPFADPTDGLLFTELDDSWALREAAEVVYRA